MSMMDVRRRLMIAALARIDIAALAIAYTGAMTDQIVTMGDGKQYRLLTLTSSGTLTVEKPVRADVWMCGGGANGNPAWTGGSSGGCGGSGGFVEQALGLSIKNLTAIVGAAAGTSSISGAASLSASGALSPSIYMFDTSIVYGATGGGGRGSYFADHAVGLKGAGVATYPFGDTTYFSGKPHCAGGGGGTYSESSYGGDDYGSDGGNGGTNGGNGYNGAEYGWGNANSGAGGLFGGGKGSRGSGSYAATNASFYGSGGGGGAAHERDEEGDVFDYTYPPSAGYQGVIYVRIPLDQKAA